MNVVVGAMNCSDITDCCEKNWDLNQLDAEKCKKFCSDYKKGCDFTTARDDYLQWLMDSNKQIVNGESVTLGLDTKQRACIRYFVENGNRWHQAGCCVTRECSDFPDNWNGP